MSDLAPVLAHPLVQRLVRALDERPAVRVDDEHARHAAVALVLRAEPAGALELLMIKRAAWEGDPWSGHIALPGGRAEPGDASLEQTARRETYEETGIDLARHGRILGALDDVHPRTPRLPPIIITPFVAALGGERPITLSDEIAEAFWVPVAMLQDPAASRTAELALAGGPRVVTSFQYGDHTIWGLTERILRQFIGCLG